MSHTAQRRDQGEQDSPSASQSSSTTVPVTRESSSSQQRVSVDALLSAASSMETPGEHVPPVVQFANAITFDAQDTTDAKLGPDGLRATPFIPPKLSPESCTPHVCFDKTGVLMSRFVQSHECMHPNKIPRVALDPTTDTLPFDTRVHVANWIKQVPDVFAQTLACQRIADVCRQHIDATYPRPQAWCFQDSVTLYWFDLDRVLDWFASVPSPTTEASPLRLSFYNAIYADQAPLINVLFESRNLNGRQVRAVTPYVFLCIVVPIVAQLPFEEARCRALLISAAADYFLGTRGCLGAVFLHREAWFVTRYEAKNFWVSFDKVVQDYREQEKVNAQLRKQLADAEARASTAKSAPPSTSASASPSASVAAATAAAAGARVSQQLVTDGNVRMDLSAVFLAPRRIDEPMATDLTTAETFAARVPGDLVDELDQSRPSVVSMRTDWLHWLSRRPPSQSTANIDDYKFQLDNVVERAAAVVRTQETDAAPASEITKDDLEKWQIAVNVSQAATQAYKTMLQVETTFSDRWTGTRTDVMQQEMLESALANAATALDTANALAPRVQRLESPFTGMPLYKNPDMDELDHLRHGMVWATHASSGVPTMGVPRTTAGVRFLNQQSRRIYNDQIARDAADNRKHASNPKRSKSRKSRERLPPPPPPPPQPQPAPAPTPTATRVLSAATPRGVVVAQPLSSAAAATTASASTSAFANARVDSIMRKRSMATVYAATPPPRSALVAAARDMVNGSHAQSSTSTAPETRAASKRRKTGSVE